MAGRSSGAAYGLGALVGLVVSAGFAGGLSLLAPSLGEEEAAGATPETVAAPSDDDGSSGAAGDNATVAAEPAEETVIETETASTSGDAAPAAGAEASGREEAGAPFDAAAAEPEATGDAVTETPAAVAETAESGTEAPATESDEAPAPEAAESEAAADESEAASDSAVASDSAAASADAQADVAVAPEAVASETAAPESAAPETADAAEPESEGADAAAAEEPAGEISEEAEVAIAEPADTPAPAADALPPFKANAEIWNGDRSEPLLAIVLVGDPGDQALSDAMLLTTGPLAIIVPSDAADPAAAVSDARDAGFEALIGLSPSQAGDAAARAALSDQVIGVALLGEGMGSSALAGPVVDIAAERGLAIFDASTDGGAAGFRTAKAEGVPAAPNGRQIDEFPSSEMIYQQLERAAFDARRTGAFVVMAKADSAVLAGLSRWMNVKANKTVTVAPLSVVMDKISRQ